MPIEFPCTGCDRTLRVADDAAGGRAACPECHALVDVPLATAPDDQSGLRRDGPFPNQENIQDATVSDEGSADSEGGQLTSTVEVSGGTESEWSLRTPDGHEYGPIAKAKLEDWISEGRVTGDCELREVGEVWRKADDLYECLKPLGYAALATTAAAPLADGVQPLAASAITARPGVGTAVTGASGPSASMPPSRMPPSHMLPERGLLIISLAILGVFICPIMSVMAWAMATADLNDMRAGRMDRRGHGLTQAGRIIAILHILGLIVVVVVSLFAMLVLVGAKGTF